LPFSTASSSWFARWWEQVSSYQLVMLNQTYLCARLWLTYLDATRSQFPVDEIPFLWNPLNLVLFDVVMMNCCRSSDAALEKFIERHSGIHCYMYLITVLVNWIQISVTFTFSYFDSFVLTGLCLNFMVIYHLLQYKDYQKCLFKTISYMLCCTGDWFSDAAGNRRDRQVINVSVVSYYSLMVVINTPFLTIRLPYL